MCQVYREESSFLRSRTSVEAAKNRRIESSSPLRSERIESLTKWLERSRRILFMVRVWVRMVMESTIFSWESRSRHPTGYA